jgi:predicted transcriptional regulator
MATVVASPMSLRVDQETRKRLKQIAERQKRSEHALATEAIQLFIQKEEEEHQLNQSCMDAYEHYQETGLHVTAEEVDQWLDTWGSENETAVPKCRV